ncbi:hypothetical protein [Sphingomonas flavescens]|jgi:hypothetical protein|uniref:hypothetical protein n=1 Tax=Sphingomonas flavescens TaxID=3132797 RepID=UPI00280594AD|nr:hypothetical protein [Sphingomonas limnosediminicola]
MRKLSRWVIAIICAAGVSSTPAYTKAKEKTAPSPLVAAIDRCRQIGDPTQRLACYDNAAGALVQAANTGTVAIVDQGEIRKARRSLFGFTLPKIPFFSGDSTADEAQRRLDSTITSVRPLNNGYYRIVIAEDNATWETSDSSVSFDPPRVGQKITILRGPLGSYFLRINGQIGVRGRRVG